MSLGKSRFEMKNDHFSLLTSLMQVITLNLSRSYDLDVVVLRISHFTCVTQKDMNWLNDFDLEQKSFVRNCIQKLTSSPSWFGKTAAELSFSIKREKRLSSEKNWNIQMLVEMKCFHMSWKAHKQRETVFSTHASNEGSEHKEHYWLWQHIPIKRLDYQTN